MKERIKKFGLRIWDKIEDHLAKYIDGAIIAIFVIASIFCWNWLIAKHALETYGFIWVIAVLGIILLSILIFWLIIREPKKKKLTDKTDIKIELDDYWKNKKPVRNDRRAYGTPEREFTIYCSQVDTCRNLKRGSTAKFLPEIIENDSVYEIKSKGKKTIAVHRKGLTIKTGPNGPHQKVIDV